MNLRDLSLEEFAGLFINKTKAVEEFFKLCNGVSAGKTISLMFNPHRLATDTEKDDLSIYESLQDDNKLSGLARLYLYNLEHGINDAFYQTVQRGYQNIQYVNEFPPIVAQTICKTYGRSKQLNVLDPCAGWGGRMIGCASIPNTTYTAFEPSTKTYEGLCKLGEWLKSLQPTFEYHVYHLPYEDKEIDGHFDIALTSPPYYDTEHYSDEPTNSLNRYDSFDSWVEGFYKPLILTTLDLLKTDGVFVLNVGSRKYPLESKLYEICKDNHIYCERIQDYLSGNGEGKEKFFCLSKKAQIKKPRRLI